MMPFVSPSRPVRRAWRRGIARPGGASRLLPNARAKAVLFDVLNRLPPYLGHILRRRKPMPQEDYRENLDTARTFVAGALEALERRSALIGFWLYVVDRFEVERAAAWESCGIASLDVLPNGERLFHCSFWVEPLVYVFASVKADGVIASPCRLYVAGEFAGEVACVSDVAPLVAAARGGDPE